ncbi:MAG TPA: adenylyltransferase/cytidyltransferase family protein [Thermoproteota archaeon]|nr:adenylyltransferase/cytidyltransferase family protein [Thermoproteota archaeon]
MKGKKVLASGVFDVLHPEHVKYLEEAKRAGGAGSKLVVVLARDKTARNMRGHAPIFSERARLQIIRALKPVDEAMLGPSSSDLEQGMKEAILKVNPDIIAFGYDQHRSSIVSKTSKVLEEMGRKNVRLIRIREFAFDDLSRSSAVKSLIARRFSRQGKRTTRHRRP